MQGIELLTMLNVGADSQKELYDLIYEELMKKGFVFESFRKALEEREAAYPTGIAAENMGVAIPHVDVEHVKKCGILAVTLEKPVTFNAMGCAPEEHETVDVECLFVILLNERSEHLKLLMSFMKIIQKPDDLEKLRFSSDPEEVKTLLRRYLPEN